MSVNIDKHVESFAANLIAASRFNFTSVGFIQHYTPIASTTLDYNIAVLDFLQKRSLNLAVTDAAAFPRKPSSSIRSRSSLAGTTSSFSPSSEDPRRSG